MPSLLLSLAALSARLLPTPVKRAIYRARPLAGLIRRGLNRAAPHGLTEITVAAGVLAGMRMQLDLQAEKDYWLGTYETDLQAALAEIVRPGMIAYDVGANVGYITLLLKKLVGAQGRVFAFEALPTNVERLRANLALNPGGAPAEVVAGAVVDHSGPVQFLVGPSDDMGKAAGSAGRQGVEYGVMLTVAGLSLDEFVLEQAHPVPEVVKIDIEGGEVLALPGMRRLLREARPTLLIELHGPEAAAIVWTELARGGYRLCQMRPGFPAVPSLEALDWKAYLAGLPL